jgi:(1->4)-alpha-D-glucan 1-alpha-D-glucosylmutase
MAFIDAVLTPEEDAPFLNDLARFVSCVAPLGLWNTMSRLALHLTAPGVPDMYQGDELWHFAFVDPDNRRPVDYARRRDLLQRHGGTLPIATGAIEALDPADPALKLRVTSNLLHLRRRHPLLFERGGYQAVDIQGARARNAVAFVRSLPAIPAGPRVVTVVGRLLGGVPASADARFDWRDTRLQLGSLAPTGQGFWRCAITGRMIQGSPGTIELASVLSGFPASVLEWNGLPSADV